MKPSQGDQEEGKGTFYEQERRAKKTKRRVSEEEAVGDKALAYEVEQNACSTRNRVVLEWETHPHARNHKSFLPSISSFLSLSARSCSDDSLDSFLSRNMVDDTTQSQPTLHLNENKEKSPEATSQSVTPNCDIIHYNSTVLGHSSREQQDKHYHLPHNHFQSFSGRTDPPVLPSQYHAMVFPSFAGSGIPSSHFTRMYQQHILPTQQHLVLPTKDPPPYYLSKVALPLNSTGAQDCGKREDQTGGASLVASILCPDFPDLPQVTQLSPGPSTTFGYCSSQDSPLPLESEDSSTKENQILTGRKAIQLYLSCDEDSLSAFQCLVRKQMEFFEASDLDVKSNAQGRNRAIVLGQVGLRCQHCSLLSPKDRGRGATYYPARLQGIYQAGQNMANIHLCRLCEHLPHPIREELLQLRKCKSSAGGGRGYWADSARILGVFESKDGLRFQANCKPED